MPPKPNGPTAADTTDSSQPQSPPPTAGRSPAGRTPRAPGNIEKRGDVYRLRLHVGGRMHRYTFPPGTAIDAVRRFATEQHRELAREAAKRKKREGRGVRVATRMSELLALYEREYLPTLSPGSQVVYAKSLAVIRRFFVTQRRDPAVDAIGGRDIEAFLAWRRVTPASAKRTEPVSNRTVARDRAILHRVFRIAERRELREGNPVAKTEAPKADPHNPVILDAEQYERLLKACAGRPMLALYLLTLGEGGMRSESEALWLRWEHVDLPGGFLWVASGEGGHRTKSGKGRWVPMSPRLLEAMKAHAARYRLATYTPPASAAAGVRSPWVFHHETTRRRHRAGDRIGSFRRAALGAITRAKLPKGFRIHDLRHRRVTTWLAEEKNPVHVKEAGGHSDLRTTMGYTHLAREHLRSLVSAPALPAPEAAPQVGKRAARPLGGVM